jgi:dihydroorotate dehydrogenase (NAD+) catalytic subunit
MSRPTSVGYVEGILKVDLSVQLASLRLKNPVLVASGTYGWGQEYRNFLDPNLLGGLITKAVTLHPREGNPPPRVAETRCGMLNAIGLANVGVDVFVREKLPFLQSLKTAVIVNVAGSTTDEYVQVVKKLEGQPGIEALEINISCPNVNVTDIAAIAQSAADAGVEAVSLVNTLLGMAIDVQTHRPLLSTVVGGLSGPAIKPVALAMVWKVAQKVSLPVIGVGGIMTAEDAVEFILAGACAVQVGTANFVDPHAPLNIIQGLEKACAQRGLREIRELVGKMVLENDAHEIQ